MVPAKEVAWKHIVLEPVAAHPSGPLGVVVVHAVQKWAAHDTSCSTAPICSRGNARTPAEHHVGKRHPDVVIEVHRYGEPVVPVRSPSPDPNRFVAA